MVPFAFNISPQKTTEIYSLSSNLIFGFQDAISLSVRNSVMYTLLL